MVLDCEPVGLIPNPLDEVQARIVRREREFTGRCQDALVHLRQGDHGDVPGCIGKRLPGSPELTLSAINHQEVWIGPIVPPFEGSLRSPSETAGSERSEP